MGSDAWLEPNDEHLVRTLWRRGARSAVIGVGIAAAVCVVVGIGLGLLLTMLTSDAGDASGVGDLLPLVADALAPLAFGATIGLTVSGASVARLLTASGGSGPDARRIRDHVLKGTPAGSPDDAVRALRWARVAAVYLPYQALSFGLLYAGLLTSQIAQLLNREPGRGLWWFSAGLIVVLVALAAVLLPLQLRNAGRARRYRCGHPPAVDGYRRGPDGPASAE